MKQQIVYILIIFLCYSYNSFGQDFGCYDVYNYKHEAVAKDFIYTRSKNLHEINWQDFNLKLAVNNGLYEEFYENRKSKEDTTIAIKMKGDIIDGLQNGEWILYSENNSTYAKGNFVNGKKENLWSIYTRGEGHDFFLSEKINFSQDILDGDKKKFDRNHNQLKLEQYKLGKKHGYQIDFSISGDTISIEQYNVGIKNGRFFLKNYFECNYENNKLDGDLKRYHNNGKLFYSLIYKNNLPYTIINIQDSSGRILNGGDFKNGTGTLNFFSPSGKMLSSFVYHNQAINGPIKHYYDSGKTMEEGEIYSKTDSINSINSFRILRDDYNIHAAHQLSFISPTNYKISYESGKLETEIKPLSTKAIDTLLVKDYYEDGLIESRSFLLYGFNIGKKLSYNEKGILESEINYMLVNDSNRHSSKEGEAIFYHPNGLWKAKLFFSNNKEIDKSFYFNDEGKLIRQKILNSNGSVYNIFKNDTVNILDSIGRKQGKWLEFNIYSCSESPYQIQYFKDNNPVGEWLTFYNKYNTISERLSWINPNHANQKYYSYSGTLLMEGEIIDTANIYYARVGNWKFYDEKGRIEKDGNFVLGQRDGRWILYNRRGKQKKFMIYKNDELIGKE